MSYKNIMPRCPKGTRKNKKTGVCESNEKSDVVKKRTTLARKVGVKTSKKLTDNEINNLSTHYATEWFNDNEYETDKTIDVIKSELVASLKKIKYDKNYTSCFGEKRDTVYGQAVSKLECWMKYGDIIQ